MQVHFLPFAGFAATFGAIQQSADYEIKAKIPLQLVDSSLSLSFPTLYAVDGILDNTDAFFGSFQNASKLYNEIEW